MPKPKQQPKKIQKVSCDYCVYFEGKDDLNIMYCNKTKMNTPYTDLRECLVKEVKR